MVKILALEDKLRQIEEEKCKGSIIRSKEKYTVVGERCTKFFL